VADIHEQIWTQLCLDASLSLFRSNTSTTDHPDTISISLTRQALSENDTNPPSGVPAACVESINLVMQFSACRRCRVPFKNAGNDPQSRKVLEQRAPTDRHLTYDRPRELQDLPTLSQERPKLDVAADDDNRSLASSSTIRTATSPPSSQNSISSIPSLSSATDGLHSFRSTATRYVYATHEVHFKDLVKIVDASLQTMISDHTPTKYSGNRGRQPKDVPIVLSSDEGRPKLAAISPALFSPGYLDVRLAMAPTGQECI